MRSLLLISVLTLCIVLFTAFASTDLSAFKAPKVFDNIHVHSLNSNKHASDFIIFIKDEVKPHYHESHTELVLIIEGEGIFYLNDTKQIVKPGDYIRIEEKQVHSVKVTSKTPLKVLSIQTPEFFGKDRVFVKTP